MECEGQRRAGETGNSTPESAKSPGLLSRFRRSERGATLVEFAIVAVPLFILILGTIEVGLVYWGAYELENATDDAARVVRTGQTARDDPAALRTLICERVSLLRNCTEKVRLNVQSFTAYDDMTPPQWWNADGDLKDSFDHDPGVGRDIVLVTSYYEWPLISPLTSGLLSNMGSGNRLLQSSFAFRNEPFPDS